MLQHDYRSSAEGKPERLAKIDGAKTLTDMQNLFIEMADESTAAPNN